MEIENQNISDSRDEATHLPANTNEGSSDNSNEKKTPNKPKQLGRNLKNAMLGGVLAGLADFLGWDVTPLRIGFVIVMFFSFGMLTPIAYLAAWIVLPKNEVDEEIKSNEQINNVLKFSCIGCLSVGILSILVFGGIFAWMFHSLLDMGGGMMADSDVAYTFFTTDCDWDPSSVTFSDWMQLGVGLFMTIILPVGALISCWGKERVFGMSKMKASFFIALIFAAGLMMLISAVDNIFPMEIFNN